MGVEGVLLHSWPRSSTHGWPLVALGAGSKSSAGHHCLTKGEGPIAEGVRCFVEGCQVCQ